jgi:hypothetical protein
MAVKTRIDSIAKDISIIVNRDLSLAGQSLAIADYARGEIAKADEKNKRVLGRVPPKTITVDGRKSAPLDSVRPNNGSIITEWELIGDVLVWIGDTLRERSPVISGEYRDAHTLYADGTEVEIGGDVPANVSELVFLNPLPYARKIEIGKTQSGRDFVIQVPNRIYERTANDARKRFGNLATIKMSYRAPFQGNILRYVTAGSGRRDAAKHERDLRVPAIVVTFKAS